MPASPIARTLDIDVMVTCQQAADGSFSPTVTYSVTGTVPDMPGLLADSAGTIDLDNITVASRNDPAYLMAININLTLVPDIRDMHGNLLQAVWASPISRGLRLRNPQGEPPATLQASNVGDMVINIYNENAHRDLQPPQRTYGYAPIVSLPTLGTLINLDPTI